ncbi:minor tail protein [Mycobacterium phage Kimona]|uniref:Glycine-rich domain-containing protein n=1 Tax=Mycobacterium phage Kimona TaxID=2024295 RepID=A0A249XU04_9CAUD|nr:minor tail protein [Mycobacterium phage Kimona]ASZ75465.1 hypothetical protein PBI_KIMONA_29 [Mycobacterium phage Kimona]
MPLIVVQAVKVPTDFQAFTTAGAWNYALPSWARYVDVVLLGGGGGGKGMASFDGWGNGGEAGQWNWVTLEVGVDIPALAVISGTVGAGGAGGDGSIVAGQAGQPGQATTAAASGWAGLVANGGAGGTGLLAPTGKSPGNITVSDRLYVGGAAQPNGSAAGNPPGGGGAGAMVSAQDGGPGAQGAAYIFTRA